MIREKGRAREIHVRVACPPIVAPCSYGIDMSTIGELFVPQVLGSEPGRVLTPEATAKLSEELGIDSLRYLTVPQLVDAMGMSENKLCLGCLTADYPTKWGNRVYQWAVKAKDDPRAGRAYEDRGVALKEVTTAAAGQPPATN